MKNSNKEKAINMLGGLFKMLKQTNNTKHYDLLKKAMETAATHDKLTVEEQVEILDNYNVPIDNLKQFNANNRFAVESLNRDGIFIIKSE